MNWGAIIALFVSAALVFAVTILGITCWLEWLENQQKQQIIEEDRLLRQKYMEPVGHDASGKVIYQRFYPTYADIPMGGLS